MKTDSVPDFVKQEELATRVEEKIANDKQLRDWEAEAEAIRAREAIDCQEIEAEIVTLYGRIRTLKRAVGSLNQKINVCQSRIIALRARQRKGRSRQMSWLNTRVSNRRLEIKRLIVNAMIREKSVEFRRIVYATKPLD
jgi:hypothetical protein